jgi:septal ring factor EnvC (AmiA/AmiB activator)
MNPAVLTLAGTLGASAITALVVWLVNHKTKQERKAGVSKTSSESDTGVSAAANQMLGRMHQEYEFLTEQLQAVRAELREARSEHLALRNELAEVRANLSEISTDRDRLVEKLNDTRHQLRETNKENVLLRARVDELEARATRNEGDHK